MPPVENPDAVYVVLNGTMAAAPRDPPRPGRGDVVVAADGGALNCLALGWPVDVLIGDFDSLGADKLAEVRRLFPDLEILPHNPEKDETDFELALGLVFERWPGRGTTVVLGALGGRWDMTFSNVLLPLAAKFLTRRDARDASDASAVSRPPRPPLLTFLEGEWTLLLLSGPAEIVLPPAEAVRRVSLLPLSAAAGSVSLEGGFRYPLDRGELLFGRTRGLSNELGPGGGRICCGTGLLLVTVSPLTP
ncbi:MAG: thiamine pyrophosphokinase [Deltaproteobacteria bacterium]|jgi:thiamine pyrophosphokinase|nr:thiamine pyrophosphokinase [Deltaproteobacteria bacterium]